MQEEERRARTLTKSIERYRQVVKAAAGMAATDAPDQLFRALWLELFQETDYLTGGHSAGLPSEQYVSDLHTMLHEMGKFVRIHSGIDDYFRVLAKKAVSLDPVGEFYTDRMGHQPPETLPRMRSDREYLIASANDWGEAEFLPRVRLYRERASSAEALLANFPEDPNVEVLDADNDEPIDWERYSRPIRVESWREVDLALAPYGEAFEATPVFLIKGFTLLCEPQENLSGIDTADEEEDDEREVAWWEAAPSNVIIGLRYILPWTEYSGQWLELLPDTTVDEFLSFWDHQLRMSPLAAKELETDSDLLQSIRCERVSVATIKRYLNVQAPCDPTWDNWPLPENLHPMVPESPYGSVAAHLELNVLHAPDEHRLDTLLLKQAESLCARFQQFEDQAKQVRTEAWQRLHDRWNLGS